MNVVDSSGWLEYFADGTNANFFSAPIEDTESLIVPTISLYEVFKRILQQLGETEALNAIAFMQSGKIVDLSSPTALHAAKLSTDLKIPMADSIMLASAREFGAILWTQDSDFEGLDDVKYIDAS
ncbi:MAG: type II toxin-antitoxin system VapC family toxin [Candidatus Scalindua sp.]